LCDTLECATQYTDKPVKAKTSAARKMDVLFALMGQVAAARTDCTRTKPARDSSRARRIGYAELKEFQWG
jgi:hypothetical protein